MTLDSGCLGSNLSQVNHNNNVTERTVNPGSHEYGPEDKRETPELCKLTGNLECLHRKAACNEESHQDRGAVWAANSKAIGTGLPKPSGVHIL